MKSSTQLLIVITALVVTGIAASAARGAETPADQPGTPGHGLRHGPSPEIMAVYDVDQNGVLDEDERAVLREDMASGKVAPPRAGRGHGGPGRPHLPPEIVAQYDANKDGQLDDAERGALRADVISGKVKLPAHRRMKHQPPPEIVAQYDANKDGQLDDTERAVLHADIESGKLPRPSRGPGRGPRAGTDTAPAN